jgi:NADH-quinone oxidoreductase subunit I
MNPISEIKSALKGMWSLVVGMSITGKYFFNPQITVRYPWKTLDNLDTYRGHIELLPKDDDPSLPRCIACGACSRVCPSQCIYVDCGLPSDDEIAAKRRVVEVYGIPMVARLEKTPPPAGLKCRSPRAFHLDFTLCSLCGQCVRTCPVSSLRFSNNVYLAGFSREEFNHIDLMERFRRMFADRRPMPAIDPTPAESRPGEPGEGGQQPPHTVREGVAL